MTIKEVRYSWLWLMLSDSFSIWIFSWESTMEKMSHRYVLGSKVKSSMSPEGQISTDRMDHITLLLVGMLLELLPTLAQVRWSPISGPERVRYHALEIDRWFTFGPESDSESGPKLYNRTILKSIEAIIWHVIRNFGGKSSLFCSEIDDHVPNFSFDRFQIVRMCSFGPDSK